MGKPHIFTSGTRQIVARHAQKINVNQRGATKGLNLWQPTPGESKARLFHRALQHRDDVSCSSLGEVRIEYADQFPTFFSQPIQAIVELLAVNLTAEKPA